MGSALIRRKVIVTIDTLRVTDLDVAFRIERDLKPEPSTAEIDLYNLTPDHRKQLQELPEDARVTLEAGYESGTSVLFRGDLTSAVTMRDGTDLVTRVIAGDGSAARRTARVSQSFAPNTPLPSVMGAITDAMGVDTGNVADIARAVLDGGRRLLEGGLTLSGNAASELTRLTRSSGLEWSVQDGRLQLLREGRALDGTAVLLSPDTGLIDAPELDDKGQLRARTLIIPDLFPGRRVQVASEFVTGLFRVERAAYTGETNGEEWTIEIDAKPEAIA